MLGTGVALSCREVRVVDQVPRSSRLSSREIASDPSAFSTILARSPCSSLARALFPGSESQMNDSTMRGNSRIVTVPPELERQQ